ncbi:DUF4352 domain-containing protein [Candidatus Saccharibacteria bacterium]|nr:DUF4352 domain-containing protein [Candidatus Saccharibacteria bacterium]
MSEREEKAKKPVYKKVWFWLLIALAAFIIIPTVTSDSDREPRRAGESGEESRTDSKVGDVIAWEGKEITVTAVERNWSSGNQFIAPNSGNEFVVVTVSIENKSDRNINFNPFDWRMQNGDGAIEGHSWTAEANNALGSGELIPNGRRSGTILFEVPDGDDNLTLHYRPSFWSNREVRIRL